MITVVFVNSLNGGNSANDSVGFLRADSKTERLYKVTNDNLLVIARLDVCHKDFKGLKALYELHLIGKNIGFVFVAKVIINHTPYGGFTRARNKRHNFYRVLSVKNIIDAIPAADLDGVDLVKVKVLRSTGNVRMRKATLIILV